MPTVLLRAITPKRARTLDLDKVNTELRGAINDTVKPDILKDFESTVRTWRTIVSFTGRTFISGSEISVKVSPSGGGAKIWGYVEEGTPAHAIYPRTAKALSFLSRYRAKTSPGVIGSRAGGASGKRVFARSVWHPGTAPRHFVKAIADRHRARFKGICENALRRAAR